MPNGEWSMANGECGMSETERNPRDLKVRTKAFAMRVMRVADALPKTRAGQAVADQLLRCGMSVGANYRAACRGRSRAEFVAKLGTVEEEADECAYWLEILMDMGIVKCELLSPLYQEANELVAIMAASRRTARRHA
jgi:four helix bundle protein